MKMGLAKHIAINMLSERIDENKTKKSKNGYDYSKFHKYIPESWT